MLGLCQGGLYWWSIHCLFLNLSVTFSQRRTLFKHSSIYTGLGMAHILSIMNTSCSLTAICVQAPLISNVTPHFIFYSNRNCILDVSPYGGVEQGSVKNFSECLKFLTIYKFKNGISIHYCEMYDQGTYLCQEVWAK